MIQWLNVPDQTVFDMTVKMYRDPFVAKETFVSPLKNREMDHYAYEYLDSEIFMFRILDTNFEAYIEERGDVEQIKSVLIPTKPDEGKTVL